MRNKGAIWTFTILLTLACLYQLSFTWMAGNVEEEAEVYATGKLSDVKAENPAIVNKMEDSVLNYWREQYLNEESGELTFGRTYQECKANEINLGLDLQGGMSVTLEVDIPALIKSYINKKETVEFATAFDNSKERQSSDTRDFVSILRTEYAAVKTGDGLLVQNFHSYKTKDKFPNTLTDEEVFDILEKEAELALNGTETVIKARIDGFGVAQPNVQKQPASGRIVVELPGVKDKERVKKQLKSTANLEFWEAYYLGEVAKELVELDSVISEEWYPGYADSVRKAQDTTAKADESIDVAETPDSLNQNEAAEVANEDSVEKEEQSPFGDVEGDEGFEEADQLDADEVAEEDQVDVFRASPLRARIFGLGGINPESVIIGRSLLSDTAKANEIFNSRTAKNILGRDIKIMWSAKPITNQKTGVVSEIIELYAIKNTDDGAPLITGERLVDAQMQFDPVSNIPMVSMGMDPQGSEKWRNLTAKFSSATPQKRSVAIVLDNKVLTSPVVQTTIAGGRSEISGSFSQEEATDLAAILRAGALPAPAKIIESSVVGPSLGEENISRGFQSFVIALIVILVYMIFYYGMAGTVTDIALLANLFFLIGVLASFHAALTLPGIAGIVLTIGMSVDANVLIYERIREELRAGKGLKLAVEDGYKRAYAAIIDANFTTLLTAIVLFIFGTGPIKGFATTLIIGIFTSLFSAIFLTRLIFTYFMDRKKEVSFSTGITKNWFLGFKVDFIGKRKLFYMLSTIFIVAGVISLMTNSLNYGVEFTGGRTVRVEFNEPINVENVRASLGKVFVEGDGQRANTEVKSIENKYNVKITTQYLHDQDAPETDSLFTAKLGEGLMVFGEKDVDYDVVDERKVDPTIADDLKESSWKAILFSMIIIFIYIVARFRKWQFGLGALIAVFHDVLVVLGIFSLCYKWMPFSLEIDQAFIAAILTTVGYSINDTVVVFDRIREYLGFKRKESMPSVINSALNSTLGRTINTSLSTFVVLFTIFLLGGDSIKGFIFALMIGVVVGTYSSLYIATPIVTDLTKEKKKLKN